MKMELYFQDAVQILNPWPFYGDVYPIGRLNGFRNQYVIKVLTLLTTSLLVFCSWGFYFLSS